MIRSCTCSRGSASGIELSKKRAASCQVCCGKGSVDSSGSLSKNMVSTVGLELTSVIKSDLTWKTISKGNRSATRRRRSVAKSIKQSEEPMERKKVEDLPVSESEKAGVNVLGRRFSDKIEHIPLKKRRFLFRSPSPPPRMHSPHPEDIQISIEKQQVGAFASPISCEQGQVINAGTGVDGKSSQEMCPNLDGNEDFSGISILAAAACSNSIEGDAFKTEEGSAAEESQLQPAITSSRIVGNTFCLKSCNQAEAVTNETDPSMEKVTVSLETSHRTQNLATMSNNVAEVSVTDDSAVLLSNHPGNKDDGVLKGPKSSRRDDRSHWDLNVIMDSWENPCEANTVSCMEGEKLKISEDCKVHTEPRDSKDVIERIVQPLDGSVALVDLHKNTKALADTEIGFAGADELDRKVHSLDTFTIAGKSAIIQKPTPLGTDAPNYVLGERERETMIDQEISISEGAVGSDPLEHIKETVTLVNMSSVSNELSSTPYASHDSRGDGETLATHDVAKDDASSVRSSHEEAECVVTPAPLSKESINEESSIDVGIQAGDCPVHAQTGVGICLKGQVEGHHASIFKSDTVDTCQLSPNCEDFSTKDPVLVTHKMVLDSKHEIADDDIQKVAELGSSSHADSKELPHTSSTEIQGVVGDHANFSGKIALEEGPLDDSGYKSEECHNDGRHLPGSPKRSELQDGYDSQYEDGELREPVVHSWEEEGDTEKVDYGSDNRDAYGIDAAADFPDYMRVQVDDRIDCRKESSTDLTYAASEVDQGDQEANIKSCLGDSPKENITVPGSSRNVVKVVKRHDDPFVRGNAGKDSNQAINSRVELAGWDNLSDGRNDFALGNQASCTGRLDSKDSISRAGRREIQSRIEGPATTYVVVRNDTTYRQGNRSNNFRDANIREERNVREERDNGYVKSVGRGGSSLYVHGRGRGGDRRVDSSGRQWGPNRHSSPSYYSPAGFVHSGPKNAAVVAAAKLESNGFVVAPDGTIVKAGSVAPNGRVRRQSFNGSPQALHRSLTRRTSPVSFGMHVGVGSVKERSPGRSMNGGRGRPVRYGPRVADTGSSDRFNGSAPDASGASLRTSHHVVRSERSFSPNYRRGAPRQSRSRTRSRSRSRTRSPRTWPSPRRRAGNGPGFRQSSRSPPNFRCETRMYRSAHQRPGFGADHVDFSATARTRGSPPHMSRWINERKAAADNFREHSYRQPPERCSPDRIFRRTNRFNLADPPIRFREDEYNRPMHSGRFSEMVGGAGRGARYDMSDDDRRKHSVKAGMTGSGRRYDTDDNVKQFRSGLEHGFTVPRARNRDSSPFHSRGSPKEYVRGIDNRLGDAPRRAREEKGHFRYGRDAKFNANSKSFGMQECDEDIAARTERP